MAREEYEVGPEAAAALTRALADRPAHRGRGHDDDPHARVARGRRQAGKSRAGRGATDIFIAPGHRFRIVGGLVTNFHVPRSSLLMLVSAFAGIEPVRRAYQEAVAARYRFYSYGDAMAIL